MTNPATKLTDNAGKGYGEQQPAHIQDIRQIVRHEKSLPGGEGLDELSRVGGVSGKADAGETPVQNDPVHPAKLRITPLL
jgi:hypothetical protein